jgi:hypothetical protein
MGNMNWRKSSYSSGNGGECIEVASPDDAVAVRDTKQDGTGPVLRFTPAAWRRFAGQVKRSLAPDPILGGRLGTWLGLRDAVLVTAIGHSQGVPRRAPRQIRHPCARAGWPGRRYRRRGERQRQRTAKRR